MASFTSGIKLNGVDIANNTIYYAKTSDKDDAQYAGFEDKTLTDLSEYGITFRSSGGSTSRMPEEFRFIKSGVVDCWGETPHILGYSTSFPEGRLKYKGKALPIADSHDVVKPIYSSSATSSRNTLDPSKWGNRRWVGTAGGTSTRNVYFRKKSSGDGVEYSTNDSTWTHMTNQNVVIFECCGGGGAGGGAWGGLFGWDAGTGGGGGAYLCFIADFNKTPKFRFSYGDGGGSKAGKNGNPGVATVVYFANSRTSTSYTQWESLGGGGGGKSEHGSGNYTACGGGGTVTYSQSYKPANRCHHGKGGDGGYKDPNDNNNDDATTTEKHGKSPVVTSVTYDGLFLSNKNSTRTGGGPRFIGKSGASANRDGGGGGGCTLGSLVNPQWTTGKAPDMTGATIYGYGGGSNGGACMDGNNYNAWAGRPGAVIAHYQTTY